MHLVLHLPEILYNIFGHCAPTEDWEWIHERLPQTSDLAALARTCRAFKEPALDVLWSELPDLSALARSVPDAIHSERRCHFGFKRPLTGAEWATLRSYARRVWIFLNCTLMEACLDEESIAMLLHSSPDPLFPNLRFLSWNYGRPLPLVHFAAQPLRTLYLDFRHADVAQYSNILGSVGDACPHIERFRLYLPRQYVELDSIISNHVLRWSNLRFLDCHDIALTVKAVLHIARMPALTRLSFILSEDLPDQILPRGLDLVFQSLSWCEITSARWSSAALLFARMRFPAITELIVRFPGSPSKRTLRSFMMALRNACGADTLVHLCVLSQQYLMRRLSAGTRAGAGDPDETELDGYSLTYDDLYPCTGFASLRSLKVNLDQVVGLTDDALVALASAWPHLEELLINHDSGWRSPGVDRNRGVVGITLDGLIRLFRACPVLRSFSLLLDTPTFARALKNKDTGTETRAATTDDPLSSLSSSLAYPARQFEQVNLVDSPLEPRMIPGVIETFVAMRFAPRLLFAWMRFEIGMIDVPADGPEPGQAWSWRDVDTQVKARLGVGASGEADVQTVR